MFNSSLFPSTAGSLSGVSSPPPCSSSPASSPSARPVSPPIFSSFNSVSPGFSPFLSRPTFSQAASNATNFQGVTASTHSGFQTKFDPSTLGKFDPVAAAAVAFPEHKFSPASLSFDSRDARLSKFEPRFEPNLSNESSQVCPSNRPSSNSGLLIQNGSGP